MFLCFLKFVIYKMFRVVKKLYSLDNRPQFIATFSFRIIIILQFKKYTMI